MFFCSSKVQNFLVSKDNKIYSLHSKGNLVSKKNMQVISAPYVQFSQKQLKLHSRAEETRKIVKKSGKDYHLWRKRDSTRSGQKALNLVRIVNFSNSSCSLHSGF